MELYHNLFVYGTLLLKDNRFGRFLHENARPLGRGKFRGKLFDIGEYPAAIYDPTITGYVVGQTFELTGNAIKTLKILDAYEGFTPGNSKACEFQRKLVHVEFEGGVRYCYVYLYTFEISKLREITSGNYLEYLSNRHSPY